MRWQGRGSHPFTRAHAISIQPLRGMASPDCLPPFLPPSLFLPLDATISPPSPPLVSPPLFQGPCRPSLRPLPLLSPLSLSSPLSPSLPRPSSPASISGCAASSRSLLGLAAAFVADGQGAPRRESGAWAIDGLRAKRWGARTKKGPLTRGGAFDRPSGARQRPGRLARKWAHDS